MDPTKALEFLAAAARQVYPIERLPDYNAAIQSIAKLIDDAKKAPAVAEESAKA